MPAITYEGRRYEAAEGQSALEVLLAGGESIPHACRAGACGACMVRAISGDVPPEAQVGLRDAWRERGYLLACQCRPRGDLALEPLGEGMRVAAEIAERTLLSPSVARVLVRLSQPFDATAGQYVTLHRHDVARSYSIAALREDRILELHVRRIPGGKMSPYLHGEAQPGDPVVVQGPLGHCVYTVGRPDQTLLLAATATVGCGPSRDVSPPGTPLADERSERC